MTALVVLSLLPPLVAVTLTENEQLLFEPRLSAFMLIVLLPGVAEMEAEQVPVKPLGEATTKPLGKESLNEMLRSSVPAPGLMRGPTLGLPRLKVNTVVPPVGIVASAKALAMVGARTCEAAFTVNVTVLLGSPAPLSFAEMGPVVLLNTPGFAAVTSTEIKHEPLEEGSKRVGALRTGRSPTCGAKSPPDKLIVPDPGVAVTVPSQLFDSWLGDATTTPAGSTSVN